MLPPHVVRAWRHGPERGAAEHVLDRVRTLPEAQQIGEVGVTTAELAHRERRIAPREPTREEARQPRLVEALVVAHGNDFGGGSARLRRGHPRAILTCSGWSSTSKPKTWA
jgi:hypothetical protein